MLRHFGEALPADCGTCDRCRRRSGDLRPFGGLLPAPTQMEVLREAACVLQGLRWLATQTQRDQPLNNFETRLKQERMDGTVNLKSQRNRRYGGGTKFVPSKLARPLS